MHRIVIPCLLGVLVFTGCETEAQRKERLERIAQQERQRKLEEERLAKEWAAKQAREAEERARLQEEREERERIAREERLRRERLLREHLSNGSQPFTSCWGWNQSCETLGCSEIVITADRNYDVLVTIKRNNRLGDVVRHAYIRAGMTFTLEVPDGTYQPFFTYGKGWDKDAVNPIKGCSKRGWFVDQLDPSKDDPVRLSANSLSYTLQVRQGGNFSTRPSSDDEAF